MCLATTCIPACHAGLSKKKLKKHWTVYKRQSVRERTREQEGFESIPENSESRSWLADCSTDGLLHCALSLAAQCIVIGPVCGFVCLCVTTITRNCVHRSSQNWVCRYGKGIVTVSSWLNFGRPAPPGRGSASGRKYLAPPYYSQRAVFASLRALFFIIALFTAVTYSNRWWWWWYRKLDIDDDEECWVLTASGGRNGIRLRQSRAVGTVFLLMSAA